MKGTLSRLIIMGLILLGLMTDAASAEGPVKVAAVFSMTGEYAPSNMPDVEGLHFAVNEINERGGVLGRRINLLILDNESTALGSKKAAERAVREGVVAVIGAAMSSHSLAMAPVLQAARIPMITPESTHPDITKTGDYIFRVCFIDDFQGEVMALFARSDLRANRAVVLTNTGNTYSIDLAKTFIRRFSQKGGVVAWEGDYLMGTTDLDALLSRVRALKPDCVFVPGYVDDSASIIKRARDQGINVPFLGGDGWDDLMYNAAGSALAGCYYMAQWHRDSTTLRSVQFVKEWEKRNGPVKSPWIAPAYDAVMLLADAARRAKSFEPLRLRDALAATKGFPGVTGDITFDANRNPIAKPAVILRFEQGRSVYVKTISGG